MITEFEKSLTLCTLHDIVKKAVRTNYAIITLTQSITPRII